METINIWTDASLRSLKWVNINNKKRRKRLCFAAFITDQGHRWTDVVYAKTAHDGELSAVISALYWALTQGYQHIHIHTDDESIPGCLMGKNKGKKLGTLPTMLSLAALTDTKVEIVYVPRTTNRLAHQLCVQAYLFYRDGLIETKRLKRKYSCLTSDGIDRVYRRGYVSEVQGIGA